MNGARCKTVPRGFGDAAEPVHAANHVEAVIRFAMWAQQHRYVPTIESIQEHFGMSRANAYRWRGAYCDATGRSRFNPSVSAANERPTVDHSEREHP